MVKKEKVQAIAFDFGGTLDAPFLHWMDIYLLLYVDQLKLPLNRENFRDSYVHAERMMEQLQCVKPHHGLLETQLLKTRLQFHSLVERGVLPDTSFFREELPQEAARLATEYSKVYAAQSKEVLAQLAPCYPLLLVSNYYGNIRQVAAELEIASCFRSITDSTLVGIRKPDPLLWKLAISREGFAADEVLVVGDSRKNDILPALSLGCQVVQGCPSMPEDTGGVTCITSLSELLTLL